MTDEKPKYENDTWVGPVTSFIRKTNSNNKDFAELVINGQMCSAWGDLIQLAEAHQHIEVRAEVSRKEGSRFWSLRSIDAIQPTHGQSAAPAAPAVPAVDSGIELRLRCAELAVRAFTGADDRTVAGVVVAYATELEHYVLDVTPKPDAA